jgi:hypothetical protein
VGTEGRQVLQSLLEEAGYTIVKNNKYAIHLKYKKKDFYHTLSDFYKKEIRTPYVLVTWDFDSIQEYFINELKIPKEKIQLQVLGQGEMGITTRHHRRTYTIGKYSKIFKSKTLVRPLIVDNTLSFSRALREVKKILDQIKHFNCVYIMYRPGCNTVGAYVCAGGLYKD